LYGRRREPIAAIVLIALGVLFLLGQFSGRMLEFIWPVALIALGGWLIFRRTHDVPPPPPPMPPAGTPPAGSPMAPPAETQQDSQGGGQ